MFETPRYIQDARRKELDDLYKHPSPPAQEKSKKEIKRERKRYEENITADAKKAEKIRKRLAEDAQVAYEYERWDPRNKA